MNIMFCDIEGTFTGPSNNRQEDLKKFSELLEELSKIGGKNQLMFCFNSNDTLCEVLEYLKEFLTCASNSTIILGPQFSEKDEWNNGNVKVNTDPKIRKMLSVIEKNEIMNIFCADDTYFNQKINKIILNKKYPNIPSILFTPEKEGVDELGNEITGLKSLNNQIEKYLTSKYKKCSNII